MNSLQIYISKLQGIVNDFDNLVTESVDETKQIATAYNKEQMIYGQDSADGIIGEYNWKEYGQMKAQMNPFADGKVDLRLTGAFHKAMNANINGNVMVIDSTDSKRNKLVAKYGEEIFGLNTKNKKRYKKDVNLYLFRVIKNRLK
jgi:hypothetical protein